MFPRIFSVLGVVLVCLLPVKYGYAGEEEPIVWVADGVSLRGVDQAVFYPSLRETTNADDQSVVELVADIVRANLANAGLRMVDADAAQQGGGIGIQVSLVHYQPGSVGGRWVGMGSGMALCIIRGYLIDRASGERIGDIIVAEQVSGGGLFSIGAEKYVVERAARKVAGEIAGIFGIKLKPVEESEL